MADKPNIVENEKDGAVVEANLDEVIQPGDERHGVHSPLVPTRDALGVHREPTPEEQFGSPSPSESQIDLPESDLEGADGRRGPVVRTLTKSGNVETPEQVFAGDALEQASSDADKAGASKAKARADAKASDAEKN